MSDISEIPRLWSDLDYWEVEFADGQKLTVRAHAMKRDAGFHIFVALMEGDPHYEYEIMRIPSGLVKSYGGGWVEPR